MNFYKQNQAGGSHFAGFCKIGTFLILALIVVGCRERQLVRTTPQMDVAKGFWIRVLLLDDIQSCTVIASSSFSVINAQTRSIEARFEEPDARVKIGISGGRIVVGGQVVSGGQVIIFPNRPHIFNLNGSEYRGKLKLIVNADGKSFDAINLVPLEPYLAGVVGAEMPYYWEPAALQAQTIAARTYCLYIKKRFGGGRNWDVKRTAAHQVYLGVAVESVQIWDAVNKTHGRVLVCNHPDGTEDIFPTYYSSTCGGHTENSKHVFGDSFPPLVGRPCPYCRGVAKHSFFFWPTAQFDKAGVTTRLLHRYPKLKHLGKVKEMRTAKQSKYDGFSRMTLVKLTGSNSKSEFLRAEDLRLTIDPSGNKLRSTICQIRSMGDKWVFLLGRGYGHGVGMCQCGAQGMAREGKTAREILLHYYPNSQIVRVY
jgi:stage II sporulation protein D